MNNSKIDIKVTGDAVELISPYHPDLPPQARNLGGQWDGKAWRFDRRDEERVRALACAVYGTDGRPVPTVTVRVNAVHLAKLGKKWAFGRQLVTRLRRDDPVKLGEGVIIARGGYPRSGGFARYPEVGLPLAGTVLEVRDVPEPLARKTLTEHPELGEIVDKASATLEALRKRAAALRAELAEIEAQIVEIEAQN